MTWTQVYNPLGNLLLSALVAALPVVVLLGLLAFFHVKAHVAAIAGLAVSMLTAVSVYGMPVSLAASSAANGAAFGLCRAQFTPQGVTLNFSAILLKSYTKLSRKHHGQKLRNVE